MISKRTLIILISATSALISILTGLLLVYLYIPTYLETKYLPEILHRAGIKYYRGDVRLAGFFGADIDTLQIGYSAKPELFINRIRIDYSPRLLLKKQINRVIISGVNLHCRYANGRFSIAGLDLQSLLANTQAKTEKTDAAWRQAAQNASVAQIVFKNALIDLQGPNRRLRLPIELIINPHGNLLTFDANMTLRPRGNSIRLDAQVNLEKGTTQLQFESERFNLATIADLLLTDSDGGLRGQIDLKGQAIILHSPLQVLSGSLDMALHQYRLSRPSLHVINPNDDHNRAMPSHLNLIKDSRLWKLTIDQIRLLAPVPILLTDVQTELTFDPFLRKLAGGCRVAFDPTSTSRHLLTATPLITFDQLPTMLFGFEAQKTDADLWQFSFNAAESRLNKKKDQQIRSRFRQIGITAPSPIIKINGRSSSHSSVINLQTTLPRVVVESNNATLTTGQINLQSMLRSPGWPHKSDLSADFKLQVSKIVGKSDGVDLNLPDVNARGRFQRLGPDITKLNAEIVLAGGSVNLLPVKTSIGSIQGRLPLKWPLTKAVKKGSLMFNQIKFQNTDLGSIRGVIQQKKMGISFAGDLISQKTPKLKPKLVGGFHIDADGYRSEWRIDVAPYKVNNDLPLGQLFKGANDVEMYGILAANARGHFDRMGHSGSLNLQLTDVRLVQPKNEVRFEGLDLTLNVADIFRLQSKPQQQIRIQKAMLGEIVVENIQIDYEIESAQSFLIENFSFSWCDGTVSTNAFRIEPEIDDYRLVLVCDRINLAKLLEQLGAAKAYGEGAVNGRIPIRIQKGRLVFEDGFLYSTPGVGGNIQFSETETLAAGIPQDLTLPIHMEIAREALKDYEYKWAKLNLLSEGEDLLLKMQFDGKPAKKLPFIYSHEHGGLIKKESGDNNAEFKGIRLNLNFRLPLNKMIQYRDILNMMQPDKE
ncbi:MAG: YdbH domain-containing protein [Desulfobacterales bacterium]|nr:YdbH domain-containing protein [Desulfobacterales bacterium]